MKENLSQSIKQRQTGNRRMALKDKQTDYGSHHKSNGGNFSIQYGEINNLK
jgi:hypothetical protein